MKAKTYTRREFERLLKDNGYEIVRCRGRGSHIVYKGNGHTVSIPKNINKMIAKRLIKENNLI